MISNPVEYAKALEELVFLEAWLNRVARAYPAPKKGMTKAGIRKLMARMHEELAVYEAGLELAESRVHP